MAIKKAMPPVQPVTVNYRGERVDCQVLRDDWWFDKVGVQDADTYQFFTSKTGKTELIDYKFEGVDALVQDAHLLEVKALLITPTKPLKLEDWDNAINNAGYKMESDGRVVDKNNCRFVSGGLQPRMVDLNSGATTTLLVSGVGTHDNVRIYTTKPIIRGGASFKFYYILDAALSAETVMLVAIYGRELVPVDPAEWAEIVKNLSKAVRA